MSRFCNQFVIFERKTELKEFFMKILNDIKNIMSLRATKSSLAVITGVITLIMLMSVMVVKRNDVRIFVDGVESAGLTTLSNDPELWLEKTGTIIYDGDTVSVSDTDVYVERAIYVNVTADGVNVTYKSAKGTVADLLANGDIAVNAADIVTPALDTEVTEDTAIVIERVEIATVTETETVSYKTEKIKTDDLYEGETEVVTEGVNGKIEHTYSVTYTDGKETSRELVSSETVTEVVNKVVKVGTRVKSSFYRSGSAPTSYKAVYTMKATAYTYGNDGGNMTALGEKTRRGIVAVDPSVIPLGTKLYIESTDGEYIYGEAVAGDTGGAIKGYKIDIFVESSSECRQFGRRNVNVYIIG